MQNNKYKRFLNIVKFSNSIIDLVIY